MNGNMDSTLDVRVGGRIFACMVGLKDGWKI